MVGKRGWDDIPATSGVELAKALRRAGCELVFDGPDRITVTRAGATIASIPLVERLRPEVVAAVAKTAGLTPDRFLEQLLDESGAGETRHVRSELPR